MTRLPLLLSLSLIIGCAKSEAPSTAPPTLSDFGKQVLLNLDELKIQPGAKGFMKDLDADAALSKSLAQGLDADAKERFQKLISKHEKSSEFRQAVVAAGGDPAACGAPSPDEKDPEPDCEKKTINLLDP